jgi:hypothetical protein
VEFTGLKLQSGHTLPIHTASAEGLPTIYVAPKPPKQTKMSTSAANGQTPPAQNQTPDASQPQSRTKQLKTLARQDAKKHLIRSWEERDGRSRRRIFACHTKRSSGATGGEGKDKGAVFRNCRRRLEFAAVSAVIKRVILQLRRNGPEADVRSEHHLHFGATALAVPLPEIPAQSRLPWGRYGPRANAPPEHRTPYKPLVYSAGLPQQLRFWIRHIKTIAIQCLNFRDCGCVEADGVFVGSKQDVATSVIHGGSCQP